jgi:cell division protein FtsN|tara:strand:- start:3553 stop:3978 length:426 start_codon:yes stop_codon:yes gene_type:complete
LKITALFLIFTLVSAQEKKIDFDPDKLKDPEPRWPRIISPLSVDTQMVEEKSNPDSVQVIVEGFRVQVLATRTRENADRLRADLFAEYGDDIYIVFEAPNYKVRIGNFIDRRQAESLRQSMVKKGYPSAWIIRTRIEPKIK